MMRYDLIIVGGGLVGAGLAAALRGLNLRIALIDARVPDNNDPRLFGLNHGSCHFLDNIGVWQSLLPHVSPIHQVHVSRKGHFGAVRLRREDVPLESLGHVVPARYIEAALNEMLVTLEAVTLYRPATLVSLKQENNEAILVVKSEGAEITLRAPVVIGADGTASTVREQAGIEVETVDYGQSAIVTQTTLNRSHYATAYERFTLDGAIAMLPLGEQKCATIWTASREKIASLMAVSDESFLQSLQQTFGYRLGRLQGIAARHHFPLRMVRARQMQSGCVLLLGNAAHTVHPVAAQGFNLAMYEVAVLVDAIQKKVEQSVMLTAQDLQQVAAQIKKQQSLSIGVSHRLAQLFSVKAHWASVMTQCGMLCLDAATPFKKMMMDGILGRTGNVPRLLLDANG